MMEIQGKSILVQVNVVQVSEGSKNHYWKSTVVIGCNITNNETWLSQL